MVTKKVSRKDEYMNILYPEFFVQALGQRADAELARRECGSGFISPPSGSRTCEKEGASLSSVIESGYRWDK